MKMSIKFVFTLFCLSLVLVSCKDENSIQTYFVDHQELPEFTSFDVSAKLVDFSNANLTEEEKDAYESIRKLDILAYRVNDKNKDKYQLELNKAKTVLNNKKYEELMEFKDNGVNVKISTIGDNDTVDEFLVLASSKEVGFTVIRVLGDDMKPEELIKLTNKLQNADVDQGQLNNLMDFFK
ncbi:DUF4252 domain-containing protein [Olleya sp. YS]|uniref:DUF4252 domain-containing protein n=1 Tax=Olleya sp. YS TaxID=3028318 RepID=UPI0024340E06|nr:DUF4252 domain-containing protein [Olleya sp. YS]WGD34935.1 DUF4252 domain-containing protein [Olleya sp. YS]